MIGQHHILSFLAPSTDLLPLFFFVLMVGLVATTIISVLANANDAKWEQRWNGSSRWTRKTADKLDAEFGSVNDICDAVATRSEKIADIMPGILLVLGLLGTFLGLGMALNEASQVLTQAGATGAGALNSDMGHLMGMMQGLGIKFKTSTWGIIGFILLRVFSEINAFNERRLRWSISKMKEEMDGTRKVEGDRQDARHQSLLDAVVAVGNQVSSVMKTEFAEGRAIAKEHHDSVLKVLGAQYQHAVMTSEAVAAISVASAGTFELMKDYVGSSTENLKKMSESAKKIGASADKLDQTLKTTLDQFGRDVQETLGSVKSSLDEAIGNFSKDVGKSLKGIESATGEMKKSLQGATGKISDALESLSGNVQTTLNKTKSALDESQAQLKEMFIGFNTTSESLEATVWKMKEEAAKHSDVIERGLNAVSVGNRSTKNVANAVDAVAIKLVDVVKGLAMLVSHVEHQRALSEHERVAAHLSADPVAPPQDEEAGGDSGVDVS